MTVREGWRNFNEMIEEIDHDHHEEIIYMLWNGQEEEDAKDA